MSSSPSQSSDDTATAARQLDELSLGFLYSAALSAVVRHRVADHLAHGPLAVDELARRSGTHAPSLRRSLRLLAARGVFHEDEEGKFRLTPTGALLRDEPGSQHDSLLWFADDLMQRSVRELGQAIGTGEPGFEIAYGEPFFTHLEKNPDAQQTFDRGMAAISAPVNDVVAERLPLPEAGTVVDVAGGRGGLLRDVLLRHPRLDGVLFDQPQVLTEHVLNVEELAGRWRLEPGDIFTSVPAGGDCYLLKHILHDWSDADCLRVLRAIRAASTPESRLLAVDAVIVPDNAPHPGKAVDLMMLALLRGRERTADEFTALFAEAGFTVVRIIDTPSVASIIEAEPV